MFSASSFSPEGDAAKPRTLLFSASNPPIFLTGPDDSDKPESDQHFSFPLIYEDDHQLSHTSLESDTFYSDLGKSALKFLIEILMRFFLQFLVKHRVRLGFWAAAAADKRRINWRTGGNFHLNMCSLSPRHPHIQIWDAITLIDEHKLTIYIRRSCPELDKDIGPGLADRTPIQFGNQDFPDIMEKNISRSAHSIKVGLSIFIKPTKIISKFQNSQDSLFYLLAVMKDVNQSLGLAPSGIH